MLYVSNSFVPYNYPLKEAKAVFLGVPFSSTSVSETSQYGPVLVREALRNKEGFVSSAKRDVLDKICDLGDVEIVPGSYELTAERIRETIDDIVSENPRAFLIFVGGEHSISLAISEALMPKTIVQLDAHCDLRSEFLGLKHSHVTWAYWAKKLLGCDIVQVGTRSWCEEEEQNKALVRSMNVDEIVKEAARLEQPVHLSIDMDVFDPCYVKTGLPEPNGLKPDDIFRIIDALKPRSMDIVEIADRSLPSNTGFLAADLIKRALTRV